MRNQCAVYTAGGSIKGRGRCRYIARRPPFATPPNGTDEMVGRSVGRGILDDVEIRELGAGGAHQLVALFAAVLPDSPTARVDEVDEPGAFLRDPNSFVLGAYIDGAPVGLAWGLQMRSPSGRLTTYVHELEVHESWRRRGVGSALITEAMTLGRRRGSTKFWLSTGGHNETAQALYESLGGDRKPLGDVNYWWDLD
jgi:ribosomal protein S18 acetylase RimI-like enzyme